MLKKNGDWHEDS